MNMMRVETYELIGDGAIVYGTVDHGVPCQLFVGAERAETVVLAFLEPVGLPVMAKVNDEDLIRRQVDA
jgi:hypothetical protein